MDVIKLISHELAKVSPGVKIYTENQKEGFKTPSFFIQKIGNITNPRLEDGQERHDSFQVVYFPAEGDDATPNADMTNMEELLLSKMTVLDSFADLLNRKVTRGDGTLLYTFEIWQVMQRVDDLPKFDGLKMEGGVKNG